MVIDQAPPLPLLVTGIAGVAGYNAFHYFRARYGEQVIGVRLIRAGGQHPAIPRLRRGEVATLVLMERGLQQALQLRWRGRRHQGSRGFGS